MSEQKKFYFAVKALILKENQFLIMHKSVDKNDNWELPGGRMEFGETAEETLVREINEETGLTVEPIRVLDTWNYVGSDRQITGIIYLSRFTGGEVGLSEEHDKFEWVNTGHQSDYKMHDVFKEKMINWKWEDIVGIE